MHADSNAHPDAVRFVRRHFGCVVDLDGAVLPRNFVIDGKTGQLVVSLPSGADEAHSIVVHVPDEGADAIQLLVDPSWLDASRDAACDRLLIYHGRAEGARFASLQVTDAKWAGAEVDGSKISLKNDLAADEPRLCRLLNATGKSLGAIIQRQTGRETIEPKVVGVDTWGIDVRTRTGLVRSEFEAQLSREQAIAMIESWAKSA